MVMVSGVNLTKANADKLAKAALTVADEEGYCGEVENILERLGFELPNFTRIVTLEVQVSGRGDVSDGWRWTAYCDSVETDDVKVVSVRDVP